MKSSGRYPGLCPPWAKQFKIPRPPYLARLTNCTNMIHLRRSDLCTKCHSHERTFSHCRHTCLNINRFWGNVCSEIKYTWYISASFNNWDSWMEGLLAVVRKCMTAFWARPLGPYISDRKRSTISLKVLAYLTNKKLYKVGDMGNLALHQACWQESTPMQHQNNVSSRTASLDSLFTWFIFNTVYNVLWMLGVLQEIRLEWNKIITTL